jgi:hypothetical protein
MLHVTCKIISSMHDTSPLSIQTGVIIEWAHAQQGQSMLLLTLAAGTMHAQQHQLGAEMFFG